jgi:hypothetical protein
MSEIFEEDPQVTMFKGGTVRPRATGLPMIYKPIKVGDVGAMLWVTVLGMCKPDRSDPTSIVVRKDFTNFDTGQAVDIQAMDGAAGTIYFLLRLTYFMKGKGRVGTAGLVNYQCSFDYDFRQANGAGLGPEDLVLQNPVPAKQDYEVHEGYDDDEITLGNFNPTVGLPGGPRFVRINPALTVSGVSSPVTIGGFTLNLHVMRSQGPTDGFVKDMMVWLSYDEGETAYTQPRKEAVLAWATKINRKYTRLADAVRDGGAPLLRVDGYASKTGNAVSNQGYGDRRVAPVMQDVARLLAVPANKISPKSFGSQEASWHWDFDSKGGAVKGPRAEDRAVAVWFEPNGAWKVVQAGVPAE